MNPADQLLRGPRMSPGWPWGMSLTIPTLSDVKRAFDGRGAPLSER
jgi:hypothetical protein